MDERSSRDEDVATRWLAGLAALALVAVGIMVIVRSHEHAPPAAATPCDTLRVARTATIADRDACSRFVDSTLANINKDTSVGAYQATRQAADGHSALFAYDAAHHDARNAAHDYAEAKRLYAIAIVSPDSAVSQKATDGLIKLERAYAVYHGRLERP